MCQSKGRVALGCILACCSETTHTKGSLSGIPIFIVLSDLAVGIPERGRCCGRGGWSVCTFHTEGEGRWREGREATIVKNDIIKKMSLLSSLLYGIKLTKEKSEILCNINFQILFFIEDRKNPENTFINHDN